MRIFSWQKFAFFRQREKSIYIKIEWPRTKNMHIIKLQLFNYYHIQHKIYKKIFSFTHNSQNGTQYLTPSHKIFCNNVHM